ncbi:hypothetical protein NQZ68_031290 [Dissostichus eleginoides]|nr:hypothetical protein NQZ68_031290 [Dissostichus eleginoides]
MLRKLLSILENESHPLHATLVSYRSTFSCRLRPPRTSTERHRRAGVTLCKEASGDTVSDECGLFKGPQGLSLSLIPQPPVGLLSARHTTGGLRVTPQHPVRRPYMGMA